MERAFLVQSGDTVSGEARCWFVSRHPGAIAWARGRQETALATFVAHLEPEQVRPGDVVMGTLPVNLAYEVCRRGARYYHLSLRVSPGQRGCELSCNELELAGARFEAYEVLRIGDSAGAMG